MTELGQERSKDRRAEFFKYQDRLVDLLCEESERIRQTKDIDDMEYLMTTKEEQIANAKRLGRKEVARYPKGMLTRSLQGILNK